MNKQNYDSVHNRFSAYIASAIKHKRINYMSKKKLVMEMEQMAAHLFSKPYVDFDEEYHSYLSLESDAASGEWDKIQNLLRLLDNERLIRGIKRLKPREQEILFARVYGDLSFKEIAERYDILPKQAEMSYYYIIKKLKKWMEGDLYEL